MVNIIYPLIKIGLMYLSKSGRAITPLLTLRFLQPCKSVPLFYISPQFLWLQACLLLSNLSLVSRRFFSVSVWLQNSKNRQNMIVSRIFIAAAITLPYVLSFPLENDLSVSVKYLEQLENRIHNLEAPGM